MNRTILVTLAPLLIAGPAVGDDPVVGGVTIGPQPAPAGTERCIEVEIGGERSPGLSCLNQQLRRAVDRVQPTRNLPPLDATSPAIRVGGFNEAGMREQLGKNFGTSVVPFRPPPPVFAAPLGPRR
jgi:hypothetical protein